MIRLEITMVLYPNFLSNVEYKAAWDNWLSLTSKMGVVNRAIADATAKRAEQTKGTVPAAVAGMVRSLKRLAGLTQTPDVPRADTQELHDQAHELRQAIRLQEQVLEKLQEALMGKVPMQEIAIEDIPELRAARDILNAIGKRDGAARDRGAALADRLTMAGAGADVRDIDEQLRKIDEERAACKVESHDAERELQAVRSRVGAVLSKTALQEYRKIIQKVVGLMQELSGAVQAEWGMREQFSEAQIPFDPLQSVGRLRPGVFHLGVNSSSEFRRYLDAAELSGLL
jgi:hypothetical protein